MTRKNPLADSLRPKGGWLRTHRHRLGLSLQAVADRLDVSPQAIHQFEKSEAAGTISLRQLANVAAAMGCRFSYLINLPPSAGSSALTPVPALTVARRPASSTAPLTPRRQAGASPPPPIEHSMFLDNQASGRFD